MKYRRYLPIKFGNMLVGLSFGIFGAHRISESLDSGMSIVWFLGIQAIALLFISGEKDIYKSENDQSDGEQTTKLVVAVLLGIVLVCLIIVQIINHFQIFG